MHKTQKQNKKQVKYHEKKFFFKDFVLFFNFFYLTNYKYCLTLSKDKCKARKAL